MAAAAAAVFAATCCEDPRSHRVRAHGSSDASEVELERAGGGSVSKSVSAVRPRQVEMDGEPNGKTKRERSL